MAETQNKRTGNGDGRPGGGQSEERPALNLRVLFDSPLMREVLANALVAAAGAAAAALVRQRPDSSERVARVAAAATSLAATTSRDELAKAGRRALGDLLGQLAKSALPGMIAAVSGPGSSGREREDDGKDAGKPRRERQGKPVKSRGAGASGWK